MNRTIDVSKLPAVRLAHNYLMETTGGKNTPDDINVLNSYINYAINEKNLDLPVYKVGLMFICINQPYWQYMQPVIEGAKNYFLPGHEVEIMCWTDMPNAQGATIFPTDSVPWPYPTLMRYHLMLNEEEYLKKFDYVFYIDLDMRFVNIVGDEIFGNGITAAQHPMYALDKKFFPPYEPNPQSAAYIPRPGHINLEGDKPRFEPLYFAGGFQGGKTADFIEAMKGTKKIIDADLTQNYIPIWNDESAWNKYLFEHPPAVVLSPSYVYPDSMIKEYYEPIWGRSYTPRLLTLTKPFTVSKEGGAAAAQMMQGLQNLK